MFCFYVFWFYFVVFLFISLYWDSKKKTNVDLKEATQILDTKCLQKLTQNLVQSTQVWREGEKRVLMLSCLEFFSWVFFHQNTKYKKQNEKLKPTKIQKKTKTKTKQKQNSSGNNAIQVIPLQFKNYSSYSFKWAELPLYWIYLCLYPQVFFAFCFLLKYFSFLFFVNQFS